MFNNISIMVHVSRGLNGSAIIPAVFPVPGSFSQSGDNTSTTQNIAFSIVAITLTITGVAIAYLQYHQARKTAIEASRINTDLELGMKEVSNEEDSMEEAEVCHVHSKDVGCTTCANACLDAAIFTTVDLAVWHALVTNTLELSALHIRPPGLIILIREDIYGELHVL
jgi:hypothetical protein